MSDAQKIILAQWSEKDTFNSLVQTDMPKCYRWRAWIEPRDYNHEILVYVQRTRERVNALGQVEDGQWSTHYSSSLPGKYILETLMEWGVPLPVTTEQRDEV